MKVLTQIFLASLIILKIVMGSLFLYQIGLDPSILEGSAIASELQKDSEGIKGHAASLHNTAPAIGTPARPPVKPVRQQQIEGKPVGQGDEARAMQVGVEDEPYVEEEKLDLDFLHKRNDELVKREQELERKKTALLAIQEDISKKIATLTRLRNEIRAEMARKTTVEEQRLKHIIKAYSAMKPQKAASLIEKLDMDFAIELLSEMKGDIVGSILSFLDPQKAAKISEGLARRE
jgi:flagellar motility protein MotE (MotC chaperone)